MEQRPLDRPPAATMFTATTDARWSSLVARRAHNPKVVGSNPTRATTFFPRRTTESAAAPSAAKNSRWSPCRVLAGARLAAQKFRQQPGPSWWSTSPRSGGPESDRAFLLVSPRRRRFCRVRVFYRVRAGRAGRAAPLYSERCPQAEVPGANLVRFKGGYVPSEPPTRRDGVRSSKPLHLRAQKFSPRAPPVNQPPVRRISWPAASATTPEERPRSAERKGAMTSFVRSRKSTLRCASP